MQKTAGITPPPFPGVLDHAYQNPQLYVRTLCINERIPDQTPNNHIPHKTIFSVAIDACVCVLYLKQMSSGGCNGDHEFVGSWLLILYNDPDPVFVKINL